MKRILSLAALLTIVIALMAPAGAADKEVTIGMQLIYNPWKVAISPFASTCR